MLGPRGRLWRRWASSAATKAVRIVEVGPRDGLQNEPSSPALTTTVKSNLIRKLAEAGLRWIEAGSFVSPKWVPQMADTAQVLEQLALDGEIQQMSSLRLPVLIPNKRGLEAALENHRMGPLLKEVAIFTAASESFSQKNTNCTVAESLSRLQEVCKLARERDLAVRGYVSTVIGCPYEGRIDPRRVKEVTLELLRMGCYEVSLGDTIGVGNAGSVRDLLQVVLGSVDPSKLAVHFHDTYGQALANVLVALESGIRTVDSAVAGLGGCPFAPGATGNVATEDLVYMLHGLDYFTGIDLGRLIEAGSYITEILGHPTRSRAAMAILARQRGHDGRSGKGGGDGKRDGTTSSPPESDKGNPNNGTNRGGRDRPL